MSNAEQLEKIKNAPGFIAALDQSGGSTPKALGLYGVTPDAWSNDDEMFGVVHQMRTRIMTSPVPSTVTGFSVQSCSRTPWTGKSKPASPTAQLPVGTRKTSCRS